MTDQPCGKCKKETTNGIICDGCTKWWCKNCLNYTYNRMITDESYDELTKTRQFDWKCEDCSSESLLGQLMKQNIFSAERLKSYGCNEKVIDDCKETSVTETLECQAAIAPNGNLDMVQIMAMFTNLLQNQMVFQEKMEENRKEEIKIMFESLKDEKKGTMPEQVKDEGKLIHAKLPKAELPKFSGEFTEWANFWESFSINVDSNKNLTSKQKLDYLHQTLVGSAFDKIKGLGLEGNKYDDAVAMLKRAYGDKKIIEGATWKALRSLPTVKENWSNFEGFTDDVRALSISLERMGITESQINVYVNIVLEKLPWSLHEDIQKMRLFQGRSSESLEMHELIEILFNYQKLRVIQGDNRDKKSEVWREKTKNNQGFLSTNTHNNNTGPAYSLVQGTSTAKSQNYPCVFCGKTNHYSDNCLVVKDPKRRKDIMVKDKRCFKCLSDKHIATECKSVKPCYYCKYVGHHSALCFRKPTQMESSQMHVLTAKTEGNETDSGTSVEENEPVDQHVHLASENEEDGIIMATFQCQGINPETNKSVRVNVYLDAGAKMSCVNQSVVERIGLSAKKHVTLKMARFNTHLMEKVEAKVTSIVLKGKNGFCFPINVYAIANMAPVLSVSPVRFSRQGMSEIGKYQPLNLPPKRKEEIPIDILIGMDYFYSLMGPKVSKVFPIEGSVVVHRTPIGDILAGNTLGCQVEKGNSETATGPLLLCYTTTEDIPKFWELEVVGIRNPMEQKDGMISNPWQNWFDKTVIFEGKRYQTKWPWKTDHPKIGSNFGIAKYRLGRTLNTLSPDGSITEAFEKYRQIFREQETTGIIEKVGNEETDGSVTHYISHFPCIKESSNTTKIRVVYDASAKSKAEGISLNDLIHVGHNYLEDILGILLRARLPKILLISDIEKAFHQVGLQKQDRNSTRFLWLKNDSNPAVNNTQGFRFTRIPFGVVASPFLLGATIKHHLQKHEKDSITASKIQGNVYMDNIFLGASNEEEAIEVYKDAKKLFWDASMNLREWVTNSSVINEKLPEKDKIKETQTKLLGIIWNVDVDSFGWKIKLPLFNNIITKRIVLHEIAGIFDPIGILYPVTIRGRILLQNLWKKNLSWDEQLDHETVEKWKEIRKDVEGLQGFSVPRMIIKAKTNNNKLLCFADASPLAYSTVIYLQSDQEKPNILVAKARVAPLKPSLTLPRLELLAILIGCRLMQFAEKELQLEIVEKHVWSDSQIAIAWITSKKSNDGYVIRRVSEIKTYGPIILHHISSSLNPADLATRGTTPRHLTSKFWLHGPGWIWDNQKYAGHLIKEQKYISDLAVIETKEHTEGLGMLADLKPEGNGPFGIQLSNYSNLRKVIRISAYCIRFIKRCQKKWEKGTISKEISVEESEEAILKWVVWMQQSQMSELYSLLKSGRTSSEIKKLDAYLDGNVVRCGGRLANAKISHNAKFPILLPRKVRLTEMAVNEAHAKACHFGAKMTLAKVREKYWIPKGLNEVKKIVKKCITCRKIEGGPFKPPKMGNLPIERVQQSRPFQFTGLDYMGPLMVKEPGKGTQYEKRWIALFTCFTTRAIHLEVVNDCTTEAAINAIIRFVSRRGTPSTILTDNATQFVKWSNVLSAIWGQESVKELGDSLVKMFATEGIKWKFIPEGSPWVGGFYERLIGLVKRALRKILWRVIFSTENLSTLLTQIEAIINSRPLLATDSESPSEWVLTPSSFLALTNYITLPPQNEDKGDPDYQLPESKDLLKDWHKLNTKLDTFWKTWYSQYLPQLRESHSNFFKQKKGEVDRIPKVGEVVLVMEENSPRLTWKIAKVQNILYGKDNYCRFAEIRLSSGKLTKRGVKELIPLEMN